MFKNLRYDLPASIVVFLVATPLCLGIALASGAPLFSGIIAGIVGGIVVGALSGSQIGVSGPAAGLAVIVLNAIGVLGTWEAFLMAVVLAGVVQLTLGYLQAGIVGYYFPSSVIKGMLAGIGLIIILKQLPHAVGYDEVPEGLLSFSQSDRQNTLSELFHMFGSIELGAVFITIVSLVILILWEKPWIKKTFLGKWIQGPLVAVVTGIVLNILFEKITPFLLIDAKHMVQIPVASSFQEFFQLITLPDFTALTNPRVYTTAIVLAVVASLETLLCVEATDKLDPLKRITPTNRELKAQGVGNIVSGLLGGLPVTQVIVRSSANIQSGGKTKLSAIIHGFLLLVMACLAPKLLNLIPLATLAAILFVVGYKLAKPATFKEVYSKGWYQFIPFVVTILGIIFTDLLLGIGLGMVVAIFFILLENIKHPYYYKILQSDVDKKETQIVLSENVSFLNRASMIKVLDEIETDQSVTIDGTKSIYIDPDVVEIIENFKDKALNDQMKVKLINIK